MLCSIAAQQLQHARHGRGAPARFCMLPNSTLPAADLLGAALCGCCCRAWQRTQRLWDRSWTPCIGPAALPERCKECFRRQQAATPGYSAVPPCESQRLCSSGSISIRRCSCPKVIEKLHGPSSSSFELIRKPVQSLKKTCSRREPEVHHAAQNRMAVLGQGHTCALDG